MKSYFDLKKAYLSSEYKKETSVFGQEFKNKSIEIILITYLYFPQSM